MYNIYLYTLLVESISIPRNADINGGALCVCYESKSGKLERTNVISLVANKSKGNFIATFDNETIIFHSTMYKDNATGLFQVIGVYVHSICSLA